MRILLTGHDGYIGTVLGAHLVGAGHAVVGCDSHLFGRCAFGDQPPTLASLRKDVRDLVIEDLAGFDAVVHLAALSNDPLGDLDPHVTDDINHRASVRLATLAKQAGVKRFVFSSSCSTYGAAGEDFLDETAVFNPVTPYGRSKVEAEQGISALADEHFSPIHLRNATAYGMSPRLRFDLVLNNLTAHAYATGKVFLKSDGSAWRPVVHIQDISRAIATVLAAPRALIHDQAFNIGRTEENYRIRDIALIVAEVVPGSRVEFSAGASTDQRNYRVNCDKFARTFGPDVLQWTVRKGALELLEAYQRHDVRVSDFEGSRYQRIAHLRKLLHEGVIDKHLRPAEYAPVAAMAVSS